ncbi:membrane protein insertion efficiency factor YidD [Herbiconiux sp. CPCC 203407]|uniref:Putative membrane protein insertion efficiency factor n=2 Tax=Herbiconiux oxytropis TaxID=2970915 RepID=A0AA42BVY7_9MICO|nr:membrane protein insertion efficiency factor YidD [Herbiconiux oxytropis]MCS5723187.1 membrane protein insertion efficiency factor YidD [Herbiconiux oxytropis]MCS5725138.1 membrane protein insertion efficiency factor YidD [Herbiconiux oxytropis]
MMSTVTAATAPVLPAWVAMILLLPRNVAIVLLRGYRAVISPLYGDVCRYYPSCSSYTLQAIQQRGLVVGSGLGIYRIVRCHPWAKGGVDDVPAVRRQKYRLTPFGFVVPASSHGKG